MSPQTRHRLLTLWLPVVAAFILIIAAWTVFITLANQNPVEKIELPPPTSTP